MLKQYINIKTMSPNYILESRNKTSNVVQVYLGAWVKIEIVIEIHVWSIIADCYYSVQALS